jgi:hypothetical protein
MSKMEARSFSRAFKLEVVRRMEPPPGRPPCPSAVERRIDPLDFMFFICSVWIDANPPSSAG